MKHFLTIVAVFIACNVYAQEGRLDTDKTIRKGVLPNGMTYYIRHNSQTKGVADFYIAQKVGSILEEPRQRGLAHFLEHMAFNGTRHFPGDSIRPGIVKWCESVGIKFGANLNAYTSVDQTVYNISAAPVTREGIIDSCLLILHDWSHDLLLADKEIDKERGVIEEEWRTRRTGMAMQRLAEQSMPVIYAGTKYADCMPIGNMDIVRTFPYNDLRDYYRKWYRPDLQAIIVVGDIDEDGMETKIRKMFGNIPLPPNPARRVYYPVGDNRKMILYTATDKEQPTVNFTLYMKRDITPKAERNTLRNYADDYKTSILRMAVNDRLEALARAADAPFISASVRDGNFFLASTKDVFELSGVLKEGRVLEGIRLLVGEVERARANGITPEELRRGKAEMLSFAENGYNDRTNRRNGEFVEACVQNFLEETPILEPEYELGLVRKLDKSVTLADINALAKDIITNQNQVVTLFGPAKEGFEMPANATIEKNILEAQTRKYAPYHEAKVLGDSLVTNLPKPGSIVSERSYKFGYTELTLSNGMKVYVRQTDFEPDEVNLKLFSMGGKNLYPDADMPNLTYLMAGATIGGVGQYDDLALEKMLAGKTATVAPYIDDDTEGMTGTSNVKDTETLLELVYLYFTQPRKDPQAFKSLMEQQEAFLTNAHVNPMLAYNDTLHKVAYGTDRLASMDKERLKKVNYDRIMQIYKERFASAADFKLILTGNINLDKLCPLLCRYMAVLPSNNRTEGIGTHGARLVDGKKTYIFHKKQATPTAITTIVIKGKMEYSNRNELLMDAIGQLLRIVYTDKVREEKGGTYSVQVSGDLQHHPADEALLRIAFQTDPQKYHELIPIVYEQLHKMATEGPSQQDLDKVKAYERKVYNQVLRMNNYWEYVLYSDLFNGIDVDTTFRSIVESMTCDDIRTTLRQLLDQNNCIEVTMTQK
ncbi:MAG: insulinase family protein [Prevotella nigrescens]|uniref:Insulinase family protein n=1 Tax=Prevotella nigrescens TaxID=28133 RepID=A0A9D5WY26_9BACT|nr:insulinase family protein [Prevotella nigrescens]MBF1445842.1 insulinase family protein [Prevotella nigrescens]MBF1452354.1 insulinase family protein [Prevotella nigrescens]